MTSLEDIVLREYCISNITEERFRRFYNRALSLLKEYRRRYIETRESYYKMKQREVKQVIQEGISAIVNWLEEKNQKTLEGFFESMENEILAQGLMIFSLAYSPFFYYNRVVVLDFENTYKALKRCYKRIKGLKRVDIAIFLNPYKSSRAFLRRRKGQAEEIIRIANDIFQLSNKRFIIYNKEKAKDLIFKKVGSNLFLSLME